MFLGFYLDTFGFIEYVLKKIMSLILEMNIEPAQPGEFTKRAFLNGRIGLTQAESVMDIISSDSAFSHRVALSLSEGNLGIEVKKIRSELIDLESQIVACIDFPDDSEDILDRNYFVQKIKNERNGKLFC